jgi:hypothetical protein
MGLELILARLEDWPVLPGWGPVRDPQRYYVTVFGDPASGEWGWRFAGHHLSLHHTITGGELASVTPSFFGADPAEAPLPGGGLLRPCGALEDLGRQLVRSLNETQLAAAMLAAHAPPDIVTGNRPVLGDGLWVTSPAGLFRDPDKVPRPVLDGLAARLAADEKAPGRGQRLDLVGRPGGGELEAASPTPARDSDRPAGRLPGAASRRGRRT